MKIPARKSRKDYYTAVVWLALIGTLIFRIPLGRIIGDKGIACFGLSNEIYLAVAGAFSFGLSEAAAAHVRYRVRRSQFKSAGKVLGNALCIGGAIGLILSFAAGVGGQKIAEKVFHAPLAAMSVGVMAPAMFFFVLTGVFRGYFQGNGSKLPAMHSEILHVVFLFLGGLSGASILHKYGQKVSALLQNDDYAAAYGAMGASLGLLAASVFCFLHVLILYFIFRRNMNKQGSRELQKTQDSGIRILYTLIGTETVYGLYYLCFHILPLLDQYLLFVSDKEQSTFAAWWGAYYGRCLVVTGIVCGVMQMVCLAPVKRIAAGMERGDQLLAKEKLGVLIHQCAVISMPAAAFVAVLAESILDLLFKGNNHQTAIWVQIWCPAIILQIFASVFMEIFLYGRKVKIAVSIGAIALALHGGCAFLLLKTVKAGMLAIVIAVILFYGTAAVLGFLAVSRLYQYRQEWIRTFGVTFLSSAVAALAALLLNKVLTPLAGAAISLVICILMGATIYMVLLVVLRAFESGELEEMAGGRLLILLAELLHFSIE
ncbi:polysaccharide biosynthesis C-terminal domain-containing protein [Parablautia intestinalis]|uniref:polysaccharide biosynthesis C-terminal domain-containing protein n=1 Tax=Parablautia intestinalis TaxID=2320100 RepID=UPI00259CA096|nr:polysaccharide biosynthesis C-terminal domain-containing protein [Parablautia intestinalis]